MEGVGSTRDELDGFDMRKSMPKDKVGQSRDTGTGANGAGRTIRAEERPRYSGHPRTGLGIASNAIASSSYLASCCIHHADSSTSSTPLMIGFYLVLAISSSVLRGRSRELEPARRVNVP